MSDERERAELLARVESRVDRLEREQRGDATPLVLRGPIGEFGTSSDEAESAAFEVLMWLWNKDEAAFWNQGLLGPDHKDEQFLEPTASADVVEVANVLDSFVWSWNAVEDDAVPDRAAFWNAALFGPSLAQDGIVSELSYTADATAVETFAGLVWSWNAVEDDETDDRAAFWNEALLGPSTLGDAVSELSAASETVETEQFAALSWLWNAVEDDETDDRAAFWNEALFSTAEQASGAAFETSSSGESVAAVSAGSETWTWGEDDDATAGWNENLLDE